MGIKEISLDMKRISISGKNSGFMVRRNLLSEMFEEKGDFFVSGQRKIQEEPSKEPIPHPGRCLHQGRKCWLLARSFPHISFLRLLTHELGFY